MNEVLSLWSAGESAVSGAAVTAFRSSGVALITFGCRVSVAVPGVKSDTIRLAVADPGPRAGPRAGPLFTCGKPWLGCGRWMESPAVLKRVKNARVCSRYSISRSLSPYTSSGSSSSNASNISKNTSLSASVGDCISTRVLYFLRYFLFGTRVAACPTLSSWDATEPLT